ncbi:acyl-CoA dehydrogenase family protein [Oceanobacillus senegalensis]|uniref:acyl-CoA dehydrogenase family protein n=1 Tax=Oceanobacillus senegalensis TaxID=1936063 RepID=UPI000A30EC84|nr:acyl-CoA dehydrogenase family protein [Oceanobacillus senegalensis]
MEYKYSDDFELLKQALDSLIKKEMPFENFTRIVENQQGFSKDLWGKLGKSGWLEIQSDSDSSIDISLTDIMYLSESFGKNLFPGPYSLTAGFTVPLLSKLNLNKTLDKVVEKVKSGELILTSALPRFERTSTGIELIWPRIDVNTQTIKGEIKQVQFAQHADYLFLPFINEIGHLTVALLNLENPNITIVPNESIDLSKPQGTILIEGVSTEDLDIIKDENTNYNLLLKEQFVNYLIHLNGEMLGGADEVLKRTVNYVKERNQFGVPVGSFQSVKHMIADMHVAIEKARSFSIYTTTQLAADNLNENIFHLISIRYFVTDIYKKVCEDAIQLHGGMGFTWEESIHFWYKSSMSHMYDIIHPTLMSEFILENLLELSRGNSAQLEKA